MTSTASPPADLAEHVQGVRRIFEEVLSVSLGHRQTQGACFYASVLLVESLQRFTPHRVVIRGGGNGDGGFLDRAGVMQGHYWVEAHAPDGSAWVLDVTADQFGEDPVRVLCLSASAASYKPGNQRDVDEVVAQELLSMRLTAREET